MRRNQFRELDYLLRLALVTCSANLASRIHQFLRPMHVMPMSQSHHRVWSSSEVRDFADI